ncbi:MAG: Rpn family recombination-promoting nuclease/putative transposase [Succinivibrio sp.]|nr:Rpn family recombination-promoting nuclease/putative transposase [Succinivibrio sp.]
MKKYKYGISSDFIFKLVFNHKQLAKKLIEKILSISITNLKVLQSEKFVQNRVKNGKAVRLDIFAKDDEGRGYDIEMQSSNNPNDPLPLRARYYVSMLDQSTINRGEHYRELKHSYVIFICNFALFGGKRRMYTFNFRCNEDTSIKLNDNRTIVFLCSKGKSNSGVDKDIVSFLDYINDDSQIKSDFVKEIDKRVSQLNQNPDEQGGINMYEWAFQERSDRARAEGRAEGQVELIITMIKENVPFELIAKCSKLTVEKVRQIAKEHNLLVEKSI